MSNSYEKYFTEKGLLMLTQKDKKDLNEAESNVGSWGLIAITSSFIWVILTSALFFWFSKTLLYFEVITALFTLFTGAITWMYYKDYVELLKSIFEKLNKQTEEEGK